MSFARNAYNAAMLPLSLGAAPFFSLHERGRVRLRERYGAWNLPPGNYLWFHGASLGEVQGLLPIVADARAQNSSRRVLVTSTSPTGLGAAQNSADEVRLLPFDSTPWIDRALTGASFSAFIFGETELWPSLLVSLNRRGIKCCLVNARISDSTDRWYRSLRSVFGEAIHGLQVVCAGDDESAERLKGLGAANVMVTGNAKFDREPGVRDAAEAQTLRQEIFEGAEPVFTLASMHPEELEVWIPALTQITGMPLRVIIAPRHSERFDHFARRLTDAGIVFDRRSQFQAGKPSGKQFVLLDTIGELERMYSFSLGAFIGGTIRDIGGHNPLEAAPYGVALFAGPSRWNIKDVARELEGASALNLVESAAGAERALALAVRERDRLREQGKRARQVWLRNRGATKKIIDALRSCGAVPS